MAITDGTQYEGLRDRYIGSPEGFHNPHERGEWTLYEDFGDKNDYNKSLAQLLARKLRTTVIGREYWRLGTECRAYGSEVRVYRTKHQLLHDDVQHGRIPRPQGLIYSANEFYGKPPKFTGQYTIWRDKREIPVTKYYPGLVVALAGEYQAKLRPHDGQLATITKIVDPYHFKADLDGTKNLSIRDTDVTYWHSDPNNRYQLLPKRATEKSLKRLDEEWTRKRPPLRVARQVDQVLEREVPSLAEFEIETL
ncbi:MAG: hypothetical protein HY556_02115 [Euryarchaeota archaeon]|nr:hypothetical protein [Euryarchaeota archaeon]